MQTNQDTKTSRKQRRAAKNKGASIDVTQTIKDVLDGKLDPKQAAADINAASAQEEQQPETPHNDASAHANAEATSTSSTTDDPAQTSANDAQTGSDNAGDNSTSADGEEQAPPTEEEDDGPGIDDIGKHTSKRRGPQGPRTGAQAGAKPLLRAMLSAFTDDGKPVRFTMEDICNETKKSDVNIRTILSDLRSTKYAGGGGVFMTESVKIGGKTYYQMTTAQANLIEKRVREADRRVEVLDAEVEQRKGARRAADVPQPQPQSGMGNDPTANDPTDAEVEQA